MSLRKEELINKEIYHVVVRGVGDSLIFKDKDDYYRAVFSLYEFNNTKPVTIQRQRQKRANRGPSSTDSIRTEREKLVEILAFCLMPNHIHLLLRQVEDEGITKFMRKLGTGYAGYFNRKYDRKGYVFQGRFRSQIVQDDNYLKIVFVYIHVNPISLLEPGWKEKGIEEPERAIQFLENYQWSSYSDYLKKKNFPSVTDRKFLLEVLEGKENCKEFIENWMVYKNEISNFKDLILE